MVENTASSKETEQLVMTINAGTHEIVKVEKVDKDGEREELSEEECAKLAGEDEVEEIEIALETAFEAGVASALDEDDEDDEDDDEERVLRGLLITGFFTPRRGAVVSRLRRRLIRQLVLRRLLRHQLLHRLFGKEKTKIPKYS
ncbi:hypothetical protein BLD44_019455 [Mastigocladus laminosus UU774]|nr:hypothetical protein AMR41_28195 [Hapalosiphon sp. MRB220]TFI52867.1 hypothetical protein BLD44_019360 [Mastigocladus laminosus UU774]TFI52881.1 hypothetical protein BLD44_019455 [Mastigocladus laminosus UU774]